MSKSDSVRVVETHRESSNACQRPGGRGQHRAAQREGKRTVEST